MTINMLASAGESGPRQGEHRKEITVEGEGYAQLRVLVRPLDNQEGILLDVDSHVLLDLFTHCSSPQSGYGAGRRIHRLRSVFF